MKTLSFFYDFFYGSIKRKLIFNVIFIHAILMGFVVYDLVERQTNFMQKQMKTKANDLALLLALNTAHPLLNNDLIAMDELLSAFQTSQEVHMTFLMDAQGKVKASNDTTFINTYLSDVISKELLESLQSGHQSVQKQHGLFIDSMQPVKIDDTTIGYTRMILTQKNMRDELELITYTGLIYIILAIIIGALFAWYSIRSTTDNLNRIAIAASHISAHNFDVTLPLVQGNDEVAKVARAFAIMTQSIKGYIAELLERDRKSTWEARHDSLTGLLSRSAFEECIEQCIEDAKYTQTVHAMLFLDLDKFKVINDTAGHLAGDHLLKEISKLFEMLIRQEDVCARFGGDEFGIMLKSCPLHVAQKKVQEIIERVENFQFYWEHKRFKIGVSIGLVIIDGSVDNSLELLSLSDTACYIAKEKGTNSFHIVDNTSETLTHVRDEMNWISKIDDAILHNRFILYVQHIKSLKKDNDHHEVLIRMKNEEGELFSPDAFLPSAHRYYLMPKIDVWVIETLFKTIAASTFLQSNTFAINLSGQSLMKEGFSEHVKALFKRYDINGKNIVFEITETAAMSNIERVMNFIEEFNKEGCHFSLDDFGTGMSSFAYLKNFKVRYLKIDGSFVSDILEDPVDKIMVESITKVAHLLHLETIAEYVENDAILETVKMLDVDFAQGYGIEKPHPLTHLVSS